jgi:hypothetical protein
LHLSIALLSGDIDRRKKQWRLLLNV